MRLSTQDHAREGFGYHYVYPVVSRRSQGLSIGINLNDNNACNWRCIYCQVPGLVRGAAESCDLELLQTELEDFLKRIEAGWMEEHVPREARRLNDIAFSGNGESTTCPNFAAAVATVGSVLAKRPGLRDLRLVLISNGSQVHKTEVQGGLRELARWNGELWFKLDSATQEGRKRINDVSLSDERVLGNLALGSRLCRTRLQTIVFALDGHAPAASEIEAYLEFLVSVRARSIPLVDVLLYGLERPSHQVEAPRLQKLPKEWLESLAERIRAVGYAVHVHP